MKGTPVLLLALAGCAREAPPTPVERAPVRWQLVERLYGNFPDRGFGGDGRVDPGATVLAFEPVYPEDLVETSKGGSARLTVEIVEIFPDREAGPGQTISATVRVTNAAPQARYRLRIDALDPRVHVLGDRERMVRGSEKATFRFTSGGLGKRGMTVDVEEIE